MSELVKKSDASTELMKVSDAPPPKLFKYSNYERFVIEQKSLRVLTPVINRDAWTTESMGAGPFESIVISLMGIFFLTMSIASPFLGGIAVIPAALILMISGAVITPMGIYSTWRHIGRVRWVKQTSARRIRAWLSANYNIHAGEIEPKLANRFLNQNKVSATMALIDEVGRAFTPLLRH